MEEQHPLDGQQPVGAQHRLDGQQPAVGEQHRLDGQQLMGQDGWQGVREKSLGLRDGDSEHLPESSVQMVTNVSLGLASSRDGLYLRKFCSFLSPTEKLYHQESEMKTI